MVLADLHSNTLFFAILKAVPNKNAGFIILLTSIFTFILLGEIRNLTTLSLLPLVNNCFSLSKMLNVCKLWTQEPENVDEEVKSLGTAWC